MIGRVSGSFGSTWSSWLNPIQAGSDISAAVLDWWQASPTPDAIGPTDQGMTATQIVQSPELYVPVRVERPVQPQQTQVPGASQADYRQDPYQAHAIQAPSFYRNPTPWSWWLGGGVFALLVAAGTGFVAVRSRRRRRR
jgi:hypothetical protein